MIRIRKFEPAGWGHLVHALKGAETVAAHLGVTATSVRNWVRSQPEGFIMPFAATEGPSYTAYGWSSEQLQPLRDWRAARLKLDTDSARAHWGAVDRARENAGPCPQGHVHEDQLLLDITAWPEKSA